MLAVNYWDATLTVFGMSCSGALSLRSKYDPNEGRRMTASSDRHVNHSCNDAAAQKERQSDPHSHALILDPFFGKIAYVPDLGMDLIRQFRYDADSGTLQAGAVIPSGPPGRTALGPRYIEFHPFLPVAYVVNELSSEISVFKFDHEAAKHFTSAEDDLDVATLKLVQTVRTIPDAFPDELNTCGRITAHAGGHFVLVSNRGHDSIAVFRVSHDSDGLGLLTRSSMHHTRGATPRHFQFASSGQWLIAANQDSDSIGVFHFNMATGQLTWTGHSYCVPSPNFVCVIRPERAFYEAVMPLAKL